MWNYVEVMEINITSRLLDVFQPEQGSAICCDFCCEPEISQAEFPTSFPLHTDVMIRSGNENSMEQLLKFVYNV